VGAQGVPPRAFPRAATVGPKSIAGSRGEALKTARDSSQADTAMYPMLSPPHWWWWEAAGALYGVPSDVFHSNPQPLLTTHDKKQNAALCVIFEPGSARRQGLGRAARQAEQEEARVPRFTRSSCHNKYFFDLSYLYG
jgi:hypothetical protein